MTNSAIHQTARLSTTSWKTFQRPFAYLQLTAFFHSKEMVPVEAGNSSAGGLVNSIVPDLLHLASFLPSAN